MKVIEPFISGFSSVPCHVPWLGPKYLFQQPIIEHPYSSLSFSIRDRISRPYKTEDATVVQNISIPVLFGKRNAIPVQAWTDPEGSRRVRLPDFKTIDAW